MSEELEEQKLNAKQKRFCEEYTIDFNATQAAIRTGYSEKTAKEIGYENLTKPHLKKYISELLDKKTLGPSGTKKLITDIATGSLNDFYKTVLVPENPLIKQPLADYIKVREEEIFQEEEFAKRAGLTDDALSEHNLRLKYLQSEIIKLQIELERNPGAFRIVQGETEMVERAVLDMEKLVKDKERGRIKSVKHTQHGIQVELQDAGAALTNMARIHSLFNDKLDLTTQGESLNKPMSQDEAKSFLEELKKENGV
ncbi:MAG: terminase small subunit [Legionellaceae bacterium]|nr:terminase small subunit [Legionellaceae bacterium]